MPAFIDALLAARLLESFVLDVELDDGSQNRLAGFYTINEERLATLDGARARTHCTQAGYLQAIYMALASLSHFRDLIERQEPPAMPPIANAIRGDRRRRSARVPDDAADARREPVVLRGLVAHWPLVARGRANRRGGRSPICAASTRMPPSARCSARPTSAAASSTTTTSPASISSRCACRLDAVLDEIARHQRQPRPPAIYVGSTTIDTCLPGFRAENDLDLGDRDSRSRASGSATARASPRITTCRTTSPASSPGAAASRCSRPSSWRTCTSARSTSRRPARRSAWSISRGRTSRSFPRFAEALRARAGRRARTRRRDLHSQHVVASHRVARRVQRAGELLVAPVAGVHGLADERADARDPDGARPAAAAARGLAEPVPALRLRGGRATPPRTFRRTARRRPRRRWMPKRARELRARLLQRLNR